MGPPEVEVVEEVCMLDAKDELRKGEDGTAVVCMDEGGSVSQDRVRKQDCRIMEKDCGASGSCVEV